MFIFYLSLFPYSSFRTCRPQSWTSALDAVLGIVLRLRKHLSWGYLSVLYVQNVLNHISSSPCLAFRAGYAQIQVRAPAGCTAVASPILPEMRGPFTYIGLQTSPFNPKISQVTTLHPPALFTHQRKSMHHPPPPHRSNHVSPQHPPPSPPPTPCPPPVTPTIPAHQIPPHHHQHHHQNPTAPHPPNTPRLKPMRHDQLSQRRT